METPIPTDEPIPVDATELINELGLQIAQLTVHNTALRIENRKLRGDGKVG